MVPSRYIHAFNWFYDIGLSVFVFVLLFMDVSVFTVISSVLAYFF